MAHFTQLGVSGKPEGKASPQTAHAEKRPRFSNQHKTAVLVAVVAISSILGIFLLESGCSKGGSKPISSAASTPAAYGQVAPAVATPSPAPVSAVQPPAKKKSRQHKVTAATYSNPAYGVSFRYPRYDNLREGDKANLEWQGLGPVEMNFVQPGGTTLSAVELPARLYSGTDFTSAFFNVSVNPKLTAEECTQFAFPEAVSPDADPVIPSAVKVGSTDFHAVEGSTGDDHRQADAKYYHIFENGMCYEFGMGVETSLDSGDATKADIKPVNRDEIFRRLNAILATVKIESAVVPDKPVPETTAADNSTSDTPAPQVTDTASAPNAPVAETSNQQ